MCVDTAVNAVNIARLKMFPAVSLNIYPCFGEQRLLDWRLLV